MKRENKIKSTVNDLDIDIFKRSKFPVKYIAKILFGQDNRRFEDEYLKKLEKS